jgi:hypothetical protein
VRELYPEGPTRVCANARGDRRGTPGTPRKMVTTATT